MEVTIAQSCAREDREELERLEVFNYLGRLIVYNDANIKAMQSNLRKARGCWAQILCVLRAEMLHSRCVGSSIRQPYRQFCYTEVKHAV